MNTIRRITIVTFLVMSLVVSGCGPGQLFGPMFTPTPALTLTPTPTSTSTLTLTPTVTLTSTPTATPTLTLVPTSTPIPTIDPNILTSACNGKGTLAAAAYGGDLHPIYSLWFEQDESKLWAVNTWMSQITYPEQSSVSIGDIQLVACMKETKQVVQNCNYTKYSGNEIIGTFSVKREQIYRTVEVKVAQTGRIIKSFTLVGNYPCACPANLEMETSGWTGSFDESLVSSRLEKLYDPKSVSTPVPNIPSEESCWGQPGIVQ